MASDLLQKAKLRGRDPFYIFSSSGSNSEQIVNPLCFLSMVVEAPWQVVSQLPFLTHGVQSGLFISVDEERYHEGPYWETFSGGGQT